MDCGDFAEFISFGNIGANEINEADYYFIVNPCNITGGCVIDHLKPMVNNI